jgi:hypothetical protein
MTEHPWNWHCNTFILDCILYERGTPAISDATFDGCSRMMSNNYEHLPEWFRKRVPKEQLDACTSVGLQYSEAEERAAPIYLEYVRSLNDLYGYPTPNIAPAGSVTG